MTQLRKLLMIGAIAALPVAATAIPAHAFGVYIGASPPYECGPYACGYYGPPAGVYIGGGLHHHYWHHW